MSVHKPTSFFPKEKQKRLAKPKAFSYIRFSTPEQMKGDSLRRQVELSKTYADKHGLELDDSLHLRDLGVSAFHGRNRAAGALAAFFKAIAEQKVPRGSFLLVESLDRLSRAQLTEALTSFLQIINAGITLVTLTDGIVYNKETCDSNMGSLMMSLVIMSRAHEESATKSKRLAAAWEAKRKRIGQTNLTSLCPGWIAPKSDGNGFKLIPERAKLVRRIFSMTLSGEGKRSIARRFNEEGIEPWGRGKRKGNGWHDSYIQKILHSRAVLGEFQPHTTITGRREALDQVVTGYYPRVIDAETFARIRRRPGLPPGPSAKVGNLFTGLAFDGYSGAVMRYVDKGIRRRERCRSRYLVSDQARLDPKKPRCAVQYSKFEERLLRSLVELDWRSVLSSDKGDSATQHECDVRDIRHELEELDAVIQRLIEVLESSDVKPGGLILRLQQREEQRQELQRKLALSEADLLEDVERSEALSDSVENLKSWADRAEDVDVRRRLRDEIRRRVRRIDLFPNGFKKLWILPRPGFDLRFSTAKLSVFRVTFVNGVARWVFPLPKSVFNMCMAEPSKDDVAESNSSSAITLVTLPG